MTDSPWHKLSDLPFRLIAGGAVELWWGPYQIKAGRKIDEKGQLRWFEHAKAGDRWLPPTGGEWPTDPSRWRPVNPDKFWGKMPRPAPMSTQIVPRLSRIHYAAGAVTEAEIAEMRDERDAARREAEALSGCDVSPGGDRVERRRWRDPSWVTYQPEGSRTRDMVEARVCRALAWCGAGRDLTLQARTPLTILARLATEAEAIQSEPSRDIERFRPLQQDHGDFDTAMGWFCALGAPAGEVGVNGRLAKADWRFSRHQKALFLRSVNQALSWGDIATGLGNRVTRQRAQQVYAGALDACLRVSNGQPAWLGKRSPDQIAALRERNRAHRLQG